jgi:ribosome-binding protein aMBF1 (putative translation factor)
MEVSDVLSELMQAELVYRTALQRVQAEAATLFVAVRKQHSLTQHQLALALSVDHSFISKVEHGHLRAGKPVLRRLAAWLREQEPGDA